MGDKVVIDGWFEIRCGECDKVLGYAFNCSEEPCGWAYSCEECCTVTPDSPPALKAADGQ